MHLQMVASCSVAILLSPKKITTPVGDFQKSGRTCDGGVLFGGSIHSRKLRWEWIINIYGKYIFTWLFFHCHVGCQGCSNLKAFDLQIRWAGLEKVNRKQHVWFNDASLGINSRQLGTQKKTKTTHQAKWCLFCRTNDMKYQLVVSQPIWKICASQVGSSPNFQGRATT